MELYNLVRLINGKRDPEWPEMQVLRETAENAMTAMLALSIAPGITYRVSRIPHDHLKSTTQLTMRLIEVGMRVLRENDFLTVTMKTVSGSRVALYGEHESLIDKGDEFKRVIVSTRSILELP